MKKYLLVPILLIAFSSCDWEAIENYRNAAKAMCDCINKENFDNINEDVFVNKIEIYARCSFDIEYQFSIDFSEDGFGVALEKECSKAMEVHEKVKSNYLSTYE